MGLQCDSGDFVRHHPKQAAAMLEQLQSANAELKAETERLQQWVDDLQSGMYINCVYCGHRYGPETDTPVAMSIVLKKHVEQCPKHPMSLLKAANAELTKEVETLRATFDKASAVGAGRSSSSPTRRRCGVVNRRRIL